MKDPQKVQDIMQCMMKAGFNTLQVVQEKDVDTYSIFKKFH